MNPRLPTGQLATKEVRVVANVAFPGEERGGKKKGTFYFFETHERLSVPPIASDRQRVHAFVLQRFGSVM